jgi:hypothetical protein
MFLYSFERELKNKLQEKTKGSQSEETVLLKAFKYFDLNDNGQVEPDEFAKAIEKIGIQIPTQQVSPLFHFQMCAFAPSSIFKSVSFKLYIKEFNFNFIYLFIGP